MDHVAILTSAAGVADAALDAAAQAFGAPARRLSANAAELLLPDGDRHRAQGSGAIAGPGAGVLSSVDLNILPAPNRKKSIFLADMDSTMISVECIDELADYAGQKTRVAEITERAMQGELDFEAALRARVALLAGVTRADVDACYETRVTVNPGAAELVGGMNDAGAVTALVSGGFTVFTQKIAARLDFQINRANTLEFDGDVLTGRVTGPIVSGATKLETLNELVAAKGTDAQAVIAVGDGANDAAMVAAAGIGVAYCAKPALRSVADAVLDHSDLTALLALQGIVA